MKTFCSAAEVVRDPAAARQALTTYGCATDVDLSRTDLRCVVFHIDLKPYPELEPAGYPEEKLTITAWRDGRILAVPVGPERDWKHRNPGDFRELCLWYPDDPPALRWEWEDGLLSYLAIAHRHLISEELWRRTGSWPVEDAPHGSPEDGTAHPIRTMVLRATGGS